MKVKVVTDLQECKRLWNKYAPKNKMWDIWEIAEAFYDKNIYDNHFLLFLTDDNKEMGLLPLYKNLKHNVYYFFGEGFPENRRFWIGIEHISKMIEEMPVPTEIFDMNGQFIEEAMQAHPEISKYFTEKDYHYFLNLKKLNHSVEEYLKTFNKKHRKNFLNDLKKLKEIKYEIIWETLEHEEEFIKFNVERFGQESDLSDEQFKKEMHRFLEVIKKKGFMHTLTIVINGKVEGIEIAAHHENKYYVLNGGYSRHFKNIGKLLIFEHIKKAAELKADEIDFLVGDTGWKQLWNFEKDLCYTFRKK